MAVRTGDTPAAERARFQREPADILITTPESLYLLLTSNAHEALQSIDTVIVDEIHALVPTKRGAHLALSMERLAGDRRRRRCSASACRPRSARSTKSRASSAAPDPAGHAADQTADQTGPDRRRHGHAGRDRLTDAEDAIHDEFTADRASPNYRAVTIVDTSQKKKLELTIEVPVEDMARMGEAEEIPSGPASQGAGALVDLERDPSAAAGTGAGAPLDAHLRQQPARRGTARRARSTSSRASRWSARITARWRGRSGSRSRTS